MSQAKRQAARRRGKPRWRGHFVMLLDEMTDSEAWCSISSDARSILIEIARRERGSNNGDLRFSTRDGARIGISQSRTVRALADLISAGFLHVCRDASFDQKRHARLFALTWKSIGTTPPTFDYRNRPAPEAPKAKRRGADASIGPAIEASALQRAAALAATEAPPHLSATINQLDRGVGASLYRTLPCAPGAGCTHTGASSAPGVCAAGSPAALVGGSGGQDVAQPEVAHTHQQKGNHP